MAFANHGEKYLTVINSCHDWSPRNVGLRETAVWQLLSDAIGSSSYGISEFGFLYGQSGGQSILRDVYLAFPDRFYPAAVAVDPQHGRHLAAAASRGSTVLTGATSYSIRDLTPLGTNGHYLALLKSNDRFWIYQTTDGGRHWSLFIPSPGYNRVASADGTSQHLYVLGNDLLETSDGGQHWSTLPHLSDHSCCMILFPAPTGAFFWPQVVAYTGDPVASRSLQLPLTKLFRSRKFSAECFRIHGFPSRARRSSDVKQISKLFSSCWSAPTPGTHAPHCSLPLSNP